MCCLCKKLYRCRHKEAIQACNGRLRNAQNDVFQCGAVPVEPDNWLAAMAGLDGNECRPGQYGALMGGEFNIKQLALLLKLFIEKFI